VSLAGLLLRKPVDRCDEQNKEKYGASESPEHHVTPPHTIIISERRLRCGITTCRPSWQASVHTSTGPVDDERDKRAIWATVVA